MFHMVWGDDEHTAAESPYARMLKARKWLYFTAASATLQTYGLLSWPALTKITANLVSVPTWMGTATIAGAGAYLLAQYTLLLAQLWSNYSDVIEARFTVQTAVVQLRSTIRENKIRLASIDRMATAAKTTSRIAELSNEKKDLLSAMGRTEESLELYLLAEPTARRLFKWSEYGIDALRALLPLFLITIALMHLALALPGF